MAQPATDPVPSRTPMASGEDESAAATAASGSPASLTRRLAADPFVLLATGLVLLTLLATPFLDHLSPLAQTDFSRWGDIVLLVLAIAAQYQGRSIEHPELRRHGRLLTAGLASWLSAQLVYFAAGGWDDPWVSATGDLLFVLFYLCMLAVALGRPHLPPGWSRSDPSYGFGLASGAVVLLFFFAYIVVLPLVGAERMPQLALSSLLIVALDFLLFGRFLLLAMQMRASFWREIYGLLALAWTTWTVVDLLDLLHYLGLDTGIPEAWGTPPQALAFAAIVCEARARAAQRPIWEASRRPSATSPWNEVAPLLAIVFLLPAVHFVLHRSGVLGEELRGSREALLVGFVLGLGLLTSVYLLLLERRAQRLSSELLEAGDELEQMRKMEAVGRVAGRAAHGFNNLLTVIQGNSELLRQRLAEKQCAEGGTRTELDPTLRGSESPGIAEIDEISAATHQAAELAWQLLAVSRRQILRPDAVDLNALVRRRAAALPTAVSVELALEPGLEPVLADAAQLERAVQELLTNAIEAMSGEGRLRLATARVSGRPRLGESGSPAAALAKLEVADNGPGIPPEVRERLFEPFVSTKGRESHAGLGLATVYGFVLQSGGDVSVTSRPGKGSTFCLQLPFASEASAAGAARPLSSRPVLAPSSGLSAAPLAAHSPVSDAPCVLVVEDEPALRKLATNALTRAGYSTMSAGDADVASALSAANPGRIALLVSDVVLPGRNGRELAAQLLAEQPRMKVVLMSGYTQDALGPDGILPPGFDFLQKPFTLEVLLRTVAAKLAGTEELPSGGARR